jgi:hypothetical protein
VIAKAFGIKISPNHCQSEENHARASLQIPAESKVNAAGITQNLSPHPEEGSKRTQRARSERVRGAQ